LKKVSIISLILTLIISFSLISCNNTRIQSSNESNSDTSSVGESTNTSNISKNEISDISDISDLSDDLESEDQINGDTFSSEELNSRMSAIESSSAGTSTDETTKKDFGVTNTKKMPNYISKISSPTLKVVSSSATNEKVESAHIAAFKAITGKDVKIERTVVEWNSMPDRVAAMVMANTAPDMFSDYASRAIFTSKKPYWENIEDFINISDPMWKDSLEMNSGSWFTKDGIKYAVYPPTYEGVGPAMGYYYNVSLVEEAIQNNSELYDPVEMFMDNKWTWDTLFKFVEEITYDEDANGIPEIYGHCMEWSRLDAYVISAGEDFIKFNTDGTIKNNLNSPNVVRALEQYIKLLKLSNVPDPWNGLSLTFNRKVGFHFGHAHWMVADAPAAAKRAGKIKWVPFPRDPKSSTYYQDDQVYVNFIPKGASNPYLAGAWYYFGRYLAYNPVKSVQDAEYQVQRDVYGWSDDEIKLYNGQVKISNLKKIIGGTNTSLDGFDRGYAPQKPETVVSKWIEEMMPLLNQAITRFNDSLK